VISIEGAEYVGPSLTGKTGESVYPHVLENRRITTHEADNRLGISSGWVWNILKVNLNMCQIAAKFMQCLLRSRRIVSTCTRTFNNGLKESQNSVTGDETWV
jgi:hypothetical protein